MALANKAKKKQWVVTKQGKFATVGGGLGARPKVYDTAAAAQHDIGRYPILKGATVAPYTGESVAAFAAEADKVNAAAAATPGKAPGPAATATGEFATTTKAKATKPKAGMAKAPKRAATGK